MKPNSVYSATVLNHSIGFTILILLPTPENYFSFLPFPGSFKHLHSHYYAKEHLNNSNTRSLLPGAS